MGLSKVGVCGNCGGDVMREDGPLWLVGEWPRPACAVCGSTVQQMEDRVLPMNPRPQFTKTATTMVDLGDRFWPPS